MQTNENPDKSFLQRVCSNPENQEIFIVVGVATGLAVYFAGGRHLRKIAKDTKALRSGVAGVVSYLELQEQMRLQNLDRINRAVETGLKFKHYPGVGVMYLDGLKQVARR